MSKEPVIYSEGFKAATVQRVLMSEEKSFRAEARRLGIPVTTVYGWKRKYAISSSMNTKLKTKKYSPEEKLEILLKTASMNETELGDFLRREGLYSQDLENFKNECLTSIKVANGSRGGDRGRPQLDPEIRQLRKEVTVFKREIRRKERALAELSSRVILLKKSHEIWGSSDEEEE